MLGPRWYPLRYVELQQRAWQSPHRFVVIPAGRRSGKTELAKRILVWRALRGSPHFRPAFFAAAPTRDQARRIYWNDLKALVPPPLVQGISEGELVITLTNGARIYVVGMDRPERIEGSPWDGGILDEYANMKPDSWSAHVRPAMSDRMGWTWFIGVPEGRNHYYDLYRMAQAEMAEGGGDSEWGAYHWVSAEVLPASEVEAARRDLDPLSFEQEYEGSFVNFEGQAYYPFDPDLHAVARLAYDTAASLCLCLDFNVAPGVAVICQEQALPNGRWGTGVIGEVHIPRNSNTPAVMRRFQADWGEHAGPLYVYGDAAGGARGTSQTEGSDWELVEGLLRERFRDRLYMRVPRANPTQRARINAVNTRLMSGDEAAQLFVDPAAAPQTVRDLEGVRLLEGGSGEIDKKYDARLTHLTDALGYYIAEAFPVAEHRAFSHEMEWV